MATKTYKKIIEKHYQNEAKDRGNSLTSTMHDSVTRDLEIKNIMAYLNDGEECMEVGCGNGAASIKIAERIKLKLTCIDSSADLIRIAKRQPQNNAQNKIIFKKDDVLSLKIKERFNSIFTQRCIINLLSWPDQKKAIKNMVAALKSNGKLILLEAFRDGLEELNNARREIGLEPISPAFHNLHLDKDAVINFLNTQKMHLIEENNFLSSYYFGSRVLYPAIAKLNQKEITYNTSFVKFFSTLPPSGNFAHIKILASSKK